MICLLKNVYRHMQDDYDFPVVIHGYPGNGKSHLALHLLETWYRVILQQPVTEDMVSQISQSYNEWLKQFKKIGPYDMNVFDEGSRDLDSLDFMTKISKDLKKLADVFRCKKFFWVVVLPSYFRLNKALREDRIRCLIWVNKRGEYKVYSKFGLEFLNALNERRSRKTMYVARPIHNGSFSEYKGVLRKPYEEQKEGGVDEVLDEVIGNVQKDKNSNKNTTDIYMDEVMQKKKEGKTIRAIAQDLGISNGTVHKCLNMAAVDKS